MKIIIIIPVYNEAEGINEFLATLKNYVSQIQDHEVFVLIFDSNSKDNTREIVSENQKNWRNLILIGEQEKTGLGSAYLQAMNYAIEKLQADVVCQCDGDGSHHPKHLYQMINLLASGYDVIIGSRYINGGQIDSNWEWYRRLISYLGNYIARICLSRRYKDYTSGFRLIRVNHLKMVINKKYYSKQYAFLINLLWYLHLAGAKIKEFPIHFIDREKGQSKFPSNNIIESLYVLLRLKVEDIKTYVKMCLCGSFGFFIQILLFNFLRTRFNTILANVISVEIIILINFFTNNSFSFLKGKLQKSLGVKIWLKKVFLFFAASHGSMLLQTVILFLGNLLFGSNFEIDNLFVFIGIILGSISNYFLYKTFIWNIPHDLNKKNIAKPIQAL